MDESAELRWAAALAEAFTGGLLKGSTDAGNATGVLPSRRNNSGIAGWTQMVF